MQPRMQNMTRQPTTSLLLETLRAKIYESNDHFLNFLLPLLGDKDQEVVAKVEKNNRQGQVKQNVRGERRAM